MQLSYPLAFSRPPGQVDQVSPKLNLALSHQVALFVLYWVAFGAVSVMHGSDATWDLGNYHIYNAFAFLHGKLSLDLAPAHMQTYFVPWVDILFFWVRQGLNDTPRALAFVLALPSAAAAWVATCIALRLTPGGRIEGRVLAVAAVAFGATGAAGLPTTGLTATEMVGGTLLLGGLLFLLTALERDGRAVWHAVAAGVLMGSAAALKLTAAPYCLAALLAFTYECPKPTKVKLSAAAAFSAGAMVGALVAGGTWWWMLFERYGNPIFPLFNNIFHSPYYSNTNPRDAGFFPHGAAESVFYPFYWGFGWRQTVVETTMRDPRFAFVYLAVVSYVLIYGIQWFWSVPGQPANPDARAERGRRLILIFMTLSFILWEAFFSILRYLAPVELLSGIIVVIGVYRLIPSARLRIARWLVLITISVISIWATNYPRWYQSRPNRYAIRVEVPPLPTTATVVLLDNSPMAYVAAFVPASVRFVGANNDFIHLGDKDRLSQQIEAAIRKATGPLFGLEKGGTDHEKSDATLAYYGLHRGDGCLMVRSNISSDARLCPLSPN
jgi:hypothetical protein